LFRPGEPVTFGQRFADYQGRPHVIQAIDLQRVAAALESAPTVAYSAPHDYPHAAAMFQSAPRAERESIAAAAMRLYIHIPFCNYACSFCCYAKHVGANWAEMQRYVRALTTELEWVPKGTPLSQFFMGGGTPTALPAPLLDELLGAIAIRMPYAGDGVHTVEASPDSVSDEHLAVLQRRAVGRISMGIQSLQDQVLDAVRRTHGPQTALDACQRIVAQGFILNIDLMYGLPGQTEQGLRSDFELAARHGVHAVTAYNLRLNEHTPVARTLSPSERFSLSGLMRWRAFLRDLAKDLGYTQTRWHTFKQLDGIAVKHRRLPTAGADLRGYQFGIGLSARSSLGHSVYRNHRGRTTYVQRVESGQSPVEELIHMQPADLQTQYIARTLGDGQPLSLPDYEALFGHSLLEEHGVIIERLLGGDLLQGDGRQLALTETGKLVYDLVMLAFYPPAAKAWLLGRLKTFQVA
jgi:oxygen-independent coproporphyrinogen-3 oxidase